MVARKFLEYMNNDCFSVKEARGRIASSRLWAHRPEGELGQQVYYPRGLRL